MLRTRSASPRGASRNDVEMAAAIKPPVVRIRMCVVRRRRPLPSFLTCAPALRTLQPAPSVAPICTTSLRCRIRYPAHVAAVASFACRSSHQLPSSDPPHRCAPRPHRQLTEVGHPPGIGKPGMPTSSEVCFSRSSAVPSGTTPCLVTRTIAHLDRDRHRKLHPLRNCSGNSASPHLVPVGLEAFIEWHLPRDAVPPQRSRFVERLRRITLSTDPQARSACRGDCRSLLGRSSLSSLPVRHDFLFSILAAVC